jgi:hypothetical protein
MPSFSHHEPFVSSYKSEQRRLVYRGREFHFVSYEGRVANVRRGEDALPAMWFLMSEGKRQQVMPQTLGQDVAAIDRALVAWLNEHVFPEPAPRPVSRARTR